MTYSKKKTNYSSNSSDNKFKSANPVFENWISEWRDDAAARDLNSKHTYSKCLNSLRKYPLPLKTGKECIILEGFGDKICKSIDDRLRKFLDDGGKLHEEEIVELDDENSNSNDDILLDEDDGYANAEPQRNANKFSSMASSNAYQFNNNDDDELVSLDVGSYTGSNSNTQKASSSLIEKPASKSLLNINKKTGKNKRANMGDHDSDDAETTKSDKAKETGQAKKKTKGKEYIPEFRSGPYALLITLYDNQKDKSEEESYMLKAQLIKEAQKHCSSSFTSTDPHNHYTAWNSMSSIIKKNLVIKENKLPARYRLTESGKELAVKLLCGGNDYDNEPEKSDSDSSDEENIVKPKFTSKPTKAFDQKRDFSPIKEPASGFKPLEANVLDKYKMQSKPTVSDCIELDSNSDGDDIIPLDYVEKKKNIPNKQTALPVDDDLPDIHVFSSVSNKFSHKNSDSDSSDELVDLNTFSSKYKTSEFSTKLSEKKTLSKYSSEESTILAQKFSSISTLSSSQTSTVSSSSSQLPALSSSKPINKSSPPPVISTLYTGTFEVILLVDNCEQSHAKRQDLLMDELGKYKVKFETTKLNVGDFAWVARPKSKSSLSDSDVILSHIVERKRVDDLCSSIIDGRYKEQKFRLKKSGIQNCIYLIEDFGSIKHMSLPEKSILQADVNTQLIDSLTVHHTNDPKDSAYYLIEMTNYLKRTYEKLTLKMCLKENLDEYYKVIKNETSTHTYLMSFNEFNKFSNKNKPLTIKEMFAKCLFKIQGVSQEKVMAILELCPTPSAIFKEYSKCPDENSRVKLIANLKYGAQQRNIGPAIGKIMSQLFYTNGPLN